MLPKVTSALSVLQDPLGSIQCFLHPLHPQQSLLRFGERRVGRRAVPPTPQSVDRGALAVDLRCQSRRLLAKFGGRLGERFWI